VHDHSPSLGNGGIISLWEEREGKKGGEKEQEGGKEKEREERKKKRENMSLTY